MDWRDWNIQLGDGLHQIEIHVQWVSVQPTWGLSPLSKTSISKEEFKEINRRGDMTKTCMTMAYVNTGKSHCI